MRTASRIRALRWIFHSPASSPVWLALRLYLASVWLQFGIGKLRGGWLEGDGLHSLLSAVAAGQTPAPFPIYARVAELLMTTGMDRMLSVAIPLVEVGVALAFVSGVALVPAAIVATLLNVNLVLSGVASIRFDGRIIALQILLLLAWRVAGYLGLGTLVHRGWRGWRGVARFPELSDGGADAWTMIAGAAQAGPTEVAAETT